MNKNINLIIKILTIILLVVSIVMATLSFNTNELGVINIFNYSIVVANNNVEATKIKSNDLVIVKDVNIKELKKEDIVSYISIENNNSTKKVGTIKDIKITKSGAHIYLIDDKNIDSSCIIGIYKSNIPILGKILKFLLTKNGFLISVVIPLIIITIYRLFYFINNLKRKEVID